MIKNKKLDFNSVWVILLIIISLAYIKQFLLIIIVSFICYLLYKYVKEKGVL